MKIYFSPHPDDVVLSCGGTILKNIKKKQLVVNVFCGRYLQPTKWDKLCGIENDPMKRRIEEDRLILKKLGVEVIYLDFLDKAAVNKAEERDINSIRREILKIVDQYNGEFFFPSGIEHPDHRILGRIGREIEEVKHYEDIPYAIGKTGMDSDFKNEITNFIDRKIDLILKYKTQLKGFLKLTRSKNSLELRKKIKDHHFEKDSFYERFSLNNKLK